MLEMSPDLFKRTSCYADVESKQMITLHFIIHNFILANPDHVPCRLNTRAQCVLHVALTAMQVCKNNHLPIHLGYSLHNIIIYMSIEGVKASLATASALRVYSHSVKAVHATSNSQSPIVEHLFACNKSISHGTSPGTVSMRAVDLLQSLVSLQ